MEYQPDSFIPSAPDADAKRAMRAVLREFKELTKKPAATAEHPLRSEMLAVLADARARIDRINVAL